MPVGHPDFGRSFVCPQCGGGQQIGLRQKRSIEQYFGSHWMIDAEKTHEYTLDDFERLDGRVEGKERAISAAMMWADQQLISYEALDMSAPTSGEFKPTAMIVFSGRPGVGKTALACAAYLCRVGTQAGLAIEYNSLMSALLSQVRDDAQGNIGEALAVASKAPVLLVDDIGTQSGQETAGRNRWFFEIVNHRYSRNLPTLYTTNLSYQDMWLQFGQRLAERLLERCLWVEMGGPSLRLNYQEVGR